MNTTSTVESLLADQAEALDQQNNPTADPDHKALEAPELADDVAVLRQMKAKIKELTEAAKPIEERIKTRLEDADAEDLIIDGRTQVTFRFSKPPITFDKAGFKKAHPSLYSQFEQAGRPRRSFLVKDISS